MPKYKTRERPKKPKRTTRRLPHRLPKDPRKLLRWAALGTEKDYEKLRELARKARQNLPAYIDGEVVEKIMRLDRLQLIEEIQAAEEHDISAGALLDGINWVLDKVPWGNWAWPVNASQQKINAMKGDGLNEVDEQYARLVGATYGSLEDRPYVLDHWKRQTEFDSNYISVWDNPDGHRLIAIRGTKGNAQDIGEDVLIGLTGRTTNLVGQELLQILAATPMETVVDLAAHSLGTTLALESYINSKQTYNAIHETYLYNAAYSPFVKGAADGFERDSRVRFFINFNDAVSMGGAGHRAPSNVVYRSEGGLISSHQLAQWQGSGVHTPQYHSPPEARVHAHKAVYGDKPWEKPITDQLKPGFILGHSEVLGTYKDGDLVDDAGDAVESAAESGELPPESQVFDFGAEDYDYTGLP